MTTSYTRVQTRLAGAYLAEIGRRWHRTEEVLAQNPSHVEIPFPIGHSALDVDGDVLSITITARTHHETTLLEDLISDQLDRLSSGEDLRYQWVRPPEDVSHTFHFFR